MQPTPPAVLSVRLYGDPPSQPPPPSPPSPSTLRTPSLTCLPTRTLSLTTLPAATRKVGRGSSTAWRAARPAAPPQPEGARPWGEAEAEAEAQAEAQAEAEADEAALVAEVERVGGPHLAGEVEGEVAGAGAASQQGSRCEGKLGSSAS